MSKIIQLKNKEGESLFPIGSEFGENARGKWIKCADGTLICSNTLALNNIGIESVKGALFGSSPITLTNYPQPFIAIPDITISLVEETVKATGRTFWATGKAQGTLTTPPTVEILGTVSTSAQAKRVYTIGYIAIGRWK